MSDDDDDDSKRDDPKRDVLFVGPRSEDGEGFRVLRRRDDALEIGELRAAKEGKPLQGDLVRLKSRQEHERLFDVEVVHELRKPPAASAHTGPAQVANAAYRSNWDAIFGSGADTPSAPGEGRDLN